jgi:hypothetical protein
MSPGPGNIWVLFDLDNGDELSKRYVWWFPSRARAVLFKREHKKQRYATRLSRPFLYRRLR